MSTNRETSALRVWLRRFGRLVVFGFNGVIAAALIVFGATALQDRAEAKPEIAAAPLPEVKVLYPDYVESYAVQRRYIGQVEAARQTDLGFELGGTVATVDVEEGQTIAKGTVIARLDTRTLEAAMKRQTAARAALESEREIARLQLERTEALEDRGFATTRSFDEARLTLSALDARLAEIDAALLSIEIDLEKSVLHAPFDATVGRRMIDDGTAVGAGQAVVALLEDRTPQIRIGLAPEVAGALTLGETFDVEIRGQLMPATLVQIRRDIDPATRTLSTLFELPADRPVPFGEAVSLILEETIATPGTWVPVSALKEGPRGLWTLLSVVEDEAHHRVVTEAVEVLHIAGERAYVRGTLPTEAPIIATGTHRVSAGQRVSLGG